MGSVSLSNGTIFNGPTFVFVVGSTFVRWVNVGWTTEQNGVGATTAKNGGPSEVFSLDPYYVHVLQVVHFPLLFMTYKPHFSED